MEEGEALPEEIHKLLEKLKLEEAGRLVKVEDDDIAESDIGFKNTIARKILTSRIINPEVFSVMMSRIWRIEGVVKVTKVGTNAYL